MSTRAAKTRRPIGNLIDEPLIEILDSLVGEPPFEAISDRSSRAHGPRLRLERRGFPRAFADTHAGRQALCHLCISCGALHEEMLGPVIDRERRRAARTAAEKARALMRMLRRLHFRVPGKCSDLPPARRDAV